MLRTIQRLAAIVLALAASGATAAAQASRPVPGTGMETFAVPGSSATSIPGNVVKQMTDLNGGGLLPGDTVVIEITISNLTGPIDAHRVLLRDPLPTTLAYVPGSIAILTGPGVGALTDVGGDDRGQFDPALNRVRVRLGVGGDATNGGVLAAGSSTSVRFRAVVKPAVASGTVIANSASAGYDEGPSGPDVLAPSRPEGGPVGPTTLTVVAPSVDVGIAKSHVGNLVTFRNGAYNIDVTNTTGSATSAPVTVTDTLAPGLTFVSGVGTGWSCSAVGQVVTCVHAGSIAPHATRRVTLTVWVGAASHPGVTNRATVTMTGDAVAANNVAVDPTIVESIPDIGITKAAVGPFVVGSNATYTLTVHNIATPADAATTVTDTLPNGLTFVSGTGTGWTCGAVGQVVTCYNPGPITMGTDSPITLTVAVGAAAAPSVHNAASVKSSRNDTKPENDTSSVTTPVTTPVNPTIQPDLAITKIANGAFAVGANRTYTLTVSNVSTSATTAPIVVTDQLPAGLTWVSAAGTGWMCAENASLVTCTNPGPLAGGASSGITLTVTVGAAAAPSVTNTAIVATVGDANPANNTSTVTTNVTVPTLDVAIVKTATTAFVAGHNATYQLAVTNLSGMPTTATALVTDVLPAGLTFVSASGAGFSCSAIGQTVTCIHSAVIPAGHTASVTLTVSVGGSVAGTLANTATVATTGDGNPANNTSTATTTVASGLDLAITKVASPLLAGSTGTYTLTVRNVGTTTTTGPITITDNLPTGLTFVSGVGGGFTCRNVGSSVTCTRLAAMAPGDVAVLPLIVNVASNAPLSIVNTATVITTGDVDPRNNTSTTGTVAVVKAVPDISVSKALATPAVAGANATFRITVTNVGGAATTGSVTVLDTLQAGLTYVGSAGAGWSCSAAGQVVTCTYAASLAPGQVATLDLTVSLAQGMTLIGNSVSGTTPGDDNDDNDTGTVQPTPTNLPPDLALTKAASGAFVIGQAASYTLTVRNVGTGPTIGPITITDAVPAGLTVTGASGPGWNCTIAGQLVTCTHPGPLAPGATSTVTIHVIPTATAVPSVTNTATVTTPGDANPANNDGSATTGVSGVIDLALDKQGPDSLTVGANASWSLVVRNVGNLPTSGTITITDTLPGGLTFVSATGPGFTCSAAGQVVTCTRATPPLGAGQSVTIDLVTSVGSNVTGALRNVACVKTPGDGNSANDCDTHTGTPAGTVDLVAFKDIAGALTVGQQATFTLAVRNLGAAPAQAPITITDTLPAGLTFVSATGAGWQCVAIGNIVTCTRGTALAAGQTASVSLVVNVGAAAAPRVTNCAVVAGVNETGSKANNRSCVDPPVDGAGLLAIEKRVSRAEAHVGDVVDYQVIVRNVGTSAVNDAIVRDILPAGFLLESQGVRVNGIGGASIAGAPGPVITIDLGRLAAGATTTVTYRVRVGPGARAGENVNVAVAASRTHGGDSPPARAKVTISGGVFDERGAIVGKVYTQCDCVGNAMQDAGEVGIPGVRVYLEDGTSAVTDVEGKYSFYDVASRLHVVKVDRTTLPAGASLVPLVNRNAGDGYTRFADVKAGELHRADFAEGSRKRDVLDRVLERRRAGEVNNAGEPYRAPRSLEVADAAPNMSPTHAQPNTGAYAALFRGSVLTEANSQVPVTPLRAQALQRGVTPSNAGVLTVQTMVDGGAGAQAPADGRTIVEVRVRALDMQGNARTGTTPVTLEASLGRWIVEDMNTTEPGVQAQLSNGEGTFTLVTAARPGQGEIRATTPDLSTTVWMTFVPANRPMLVTGLVNARVDFLKLVNGGLALGSNDRFEDELRDGMLTDDSAKTRAGARAALLMKGTVLDNRLLTLSYDSERDRGRTFFRDIRPEDYFPVYGDASMREFDAQSRRRFYGRLDKGTGYTMYGDFQTTRADDRRVLSSYDRSLTGAVQHFEGKGGAATFFASRGRITQAVDEIAGRGISGPYAMTRTSGLVNSERVEIIVRDRNQPSLILTRTPMTRFADYTIEPVSGRLIFRSPVPSADANLNPVSIRVTYETENGNSEAFWVYGLDGSVRAGDRLELGGTLARDENPSASHQLIGLNATAKLGAGTTLFAEYAGTKDASGETGSAQRVELRHQSAGFDARAFAVHSDDAFYNQSSIYAGGRTEVGGRFSRQLAEGTNLVGEAIRTELGGSDQRRQGALLAIERQFNESVRAELGYRFVKDNTPAAGLPTNGLVDRDVSALRGRVQYTLPKETRTSIFGEVEQDIREADQRRLAVGGEYILSNRARLYARHEILSGLDDPYVPTGAGDKQVTVFGVDADYLRNTQMFSEYRARDAFAGRDAEASIGLRNRFALAPGLLVNTSFERVSPLTAPGVSSGNDALAVTGAVEWTRPDLWKSTARLEFRNADTGDNALASFGYARKLSRDWTLLGRTLWDDYDAAQRQTRGFSQLGVSWRETDSNRWNALARYEHRFERHSATPTQLATRDLAHVLAALVNYQPVQRFTFSGRYAARMSSNQANGTETNSTAQLFMGRGVMDLSSRFDVGVISSALVSDGFSDRRYGLGGELGLIMMKNLRIAGGYNVFGFTDRDLQSLGTTRRGPYLELGFKFDESLFGIGDSKASGSTSKEEE